MITRRKFAASTAAGYVRIAGANERIGLGYIGLGGRGDRVHEVFLECADSRTAAVCDLRDDYMDWAVSKSLGAPCKYKDYRRLLEDREVDAVVISTPDHWHALQFIDACRAGKDIFIEKPLSLTVFEGRKMLEAARASKRVVQVGTQRRSSSMIREAVEFVRAGGIGQVTVARAFDILSEWPHGIGNPPDQVPPEDWDWDQWLGPAPAVPYNPNRAFYKYRWFTHYSCGQLTNNGIHLVDVIRWCLGREWPRRVTALGGRYAVKDNREIPDTLEVIWEYEGGPLVTFTQLNANDAPGNARGAEIELRGTKGTLYIHNDRWEADPEPVSAYQRFAITPLNRADGRAKWAAARKPGMEGRTVKGPALADRAHVRNFLDCIRTRALCNADIRDGHISTSTCILGSIAHKTGALLAWNGRFERFESGSAANSLLHYRYRAPYRLPD